MSTLSDRLRELRGATSQAEMARQLGMQRAQWIRYETGVTVPGADILANICRIHAADANWLLGLPTRGGSTTVTGNQGAVAIGTGARANYAPKTEVSDQCKTCKYKRLADAFKAL